MSEHQSEDPLFEDCHHCGACGPPRYHGAECPVTIAWIRQMERAYFWYNLTNPIRRLGRWLASI